MSKQIFCTTSNQSIGGTFLDWSVHYLNNQDKFFSTELGWIDLVNNPLTKNNAHGHLRNHPVGFEDSEKVVHIFNKESDGLFSFYAYALQYDKCASALNIPIESIGENENYTNILRYREKNFSEIWDMCNANNIQLIYLQLTDAPLYMLSPRTLRRKISSPGAYQSSDEILKENIEIFFKNNTTNFFKNNDFSSWTKSDLRDKNNNFSSWTKWDLREYLSLNIRPFEMSNVDKSLDFSKPHFYINANEWWLNGSQTIVDVMEYLKLAVNKDRFSKWIDIYKSWQKIQIQILKFQWNFDHICDSIVNNKFYSLKEYNLSLSQEAAIQHVMLYKYGLNFKIYGLEKFPNNTQDLHVLLEANVDHNIEDIYGCLK